MIKVNKKWATEMGNLITKIKNLKEEPPVIIINGERTGGVLESLLSGFIFFSPNFLLSFSWFSERLWLLLLYNYFVMFLLCSTIAHIKFKG